MMRSGICLGMRAALLIGLLCVGMAGCTQRIPEDGEYAAGTPIIETLFWNTTIKLSGGASPCVGELCFDDIFEEVPVPLQDGVLEGLAVRAEWTVPEGSVRADALILDGRHVHDNGESDHLFRIEGRSPLNHREESLAAKLDANSSLSLFIQYVHEQGPADVSLREDVDLHLAVIALLRPERT